MSVKGYFQFVKWYFVHRGKVCFRDPPSLPLGKKILASLLGTHVTMYRKDRLPNVIFAYVLLIIFFPLALFVLPLHMPFGMACLWALLAVILASNLLHWSQFSFLYYLVLYTRYIHREDSINDRIIVEYTILREYPKDVARMIQKYYYIRYMTSKTNRVRYHLVERRKKHKNIGKKDFLVLEITHDKIFFNKQEIFSEKIKDLTVLEDFLREMQKQTG